MDLITESCDDYVQIFDGNSTNNTSLDKFCGNLYSRSTTQVTSTSNVMTVKFSVRHDSLTPRFTDTTIHWHNDSLTQRFTDTTIHWHNDSLTQRFTDNKKKCLFY
jgi:hypothetical protein